MDYD
jgi:hypothetical protein